MASTLPQRSTASPWKSMTLTWRHAWKALDWVKWQFSSVLLVSDSMALLTLLVRPQVSWTLYAPCPSCLRILCNFFDGRSCFYSTRVAKQQADVIVSSSGNSYKYVNMICVLSIMCNTGICTSVVCCFSLVFRIARAVKIVAYFSLIFHYKTLWMEINCMYLSSKTEERKRTGKKLRTHKHSHLYAWYNAEY